MDLIRLLKHHTTRNEIFISCPECKRLHELQPTLYLFFSKNETDTNQYTNKTAPLILMGKTEEEKS